MTKVRIIALAVTILALSAIMLPGMASPTQAQEVITPGTPVTGTLSGSSASYSVDATAGSLLIMSVESDAFDATVAIKDGSGTELADDDDSGEGSNPVLAYVVQADGSFEVVVDGWSDPNGEFTLNVESITPTMVDIGGTVNLAPEGRPNVYAVFAGTADSVVDVRASSTGEDDLRMNLVGVNAAEIESDDDDGPGRDPLLRRVVLPADGLYLVTASAIFEDIPTANVDVTVEATERLFIDATPQDLTLSDDDLGTEVYTFEATAGTTYRAIVTSANNTGIALEILDSDAFFTPDMESGNALRVTWDFRSDVSGLLRLVVHPSFFSDGDVYKISVETVE